MYFGVFIGRVNVIGYCVVVKVIQYIDYVGNGWYIGCKVFKIVFVYQVWLVVWQFFFCQFFDYGLNVFQGVFYKLLLVFQVCDGKVKFCNVFGQGGVCQMFCVD